MTFLYFFFGTILGFIVAMIFLGLARASRIADLEAEAEYWRRVAQDLMRDLE